MIVKSDITAVGVAVPERLGTEEDDDLDNLEEEYLMEPDRATPILPRQIQALTIDQDDAFGAT